MSLNSFKPSTAGAHDPGAVVVFFDARDCGGPADGPQMSSVTRYYIDGLHKLGWANYWYPPNIEPGKVRLVWWTHAGNEGHRDYPLYQALAVHEMFSSLRDEGFRPMVMGWSNENPFPMIGGSEPPPEPVKKAPKVRKATSASGYFSGHGGKAGATPHDRVMAIIEHEEEREAKSRAEDVKVGEKDGLLAV